MNKKVYTDFNNKYRCIFIHIPKTGGLSIKNTMYENKKTGIGHRRISDYHDADIELFNSYFKFSVVRNPWDRFVSSYFYLKSGGRNQSDKEWAKQYLEKYENIKDFIHDLSSSEEKRKKVMNFIHFIPQYQFICIDDQIMVDYIGRFEKLDDCFRHVNSVLNLNLKLPHDNKSGHQMYRHYYDEDTKKIVSYLYKKDIEMLEYTFN